MDKNQRTRYLQMWVAFSDNSAEYVLKDPISNITRYYVGNLKLVSEKPTFKGNVVTVFKNNIEKLVTIKSINEEHSIEDAKNLSMMNLVEKLRTKTLIKNHQDLF
jgi:hypothetical protein